VYEHGSQRFNDMKSFVPTLNMPNVSMPTMRYPPMGQLATRMRSGMDNMFIQFREFCGSSDITHTASMADIEAHMSASSAVGNNTYIMGPMRSGDSHTQMIPNNVNSTYYQRFLQMIREEHSKRAKSKKTPINQHAKISEEDEEDDAYLDSEDSEAEQIRQGQRRIPRTTTTATCLDENAPTTSAYATASSSSGSLQDSADKEPQLPRIRLEDKLNGSNLEEKNVDDEKEAEVPKQKTSRADSVNGSVHEQEVQLATTSI
jgi:hypothetical protein